MNRNPDQPDPDRFDIPEVVDIFLEDGGDTTVRPCSPEVKAFLEAQRERVRRLLLASQQTPPKDSAPAGQ